MNKLKYLVGFISLAFGLITPKSHSEQTDSQISTDNQDPVYTELLHQQDAQAQAAQHALELSGIGVL